MYATATFLGLGLVFWPLKGQIFQKRERFVNFQHGAVKSQPTTAVVPVAADIAGIVVVIY